MTCLSAASVRRVVNYETNAGVTQVEVEMGSAGYLQNALPFGVRRSIACECAIQVQGCAYTKGGVLKIGRQAHLPDVKSEARSFRRHLPIKTPKKHQLIT